MPQPMQQTHQMHQVHQTGQIAAPILELWIPFNLINPRNVKQRKGLLGLRMIKGRIIEQEGWSDSAICAPIRSALELTRMETSAGINVPKRVERIGRIPSISRIARKRYETRRRRTSRKRCIWKAKTRANNTYTRARLVFLAEIHVRRPIVRPKAL